MKSKGNDINITYLNLAAQTPSIELNLALSEKIHREDPSKKHYLFMCDKALKSCSVNVFNSKRVCEICTHKAKKGFKVFNKRNPHSELIKIKRKDLFSKKIDRTKFDSNTVNEFLLGTHSTIGSQLRLDDMNLLDNRWKRVKEKMFESSFALYSYFDSFISRPELKTKNFIIFNGRLSCSRPLIEVSKHHNVNYYLFDAAVNGKVPMYSKNEMIHSIEFEKRNSVVTYLKHFKNSKELAQQYFKYKRKQIPINDIAYTKNQVSNHIDSHILSLKKPIISIYVSSDDEYRFIGTDWASYKIVDQIQSIRELIKSKLSDHYDFVVKMHPNQNRIHNSIMNRYVELSNETNVLFPDNETDSYALIEYSEIVLNYCSSIAVEANYLRKPVIQIGPSKFIKFSIANIVYSTEDAIKLILSKKYKIMPIRGSIISFTYHMRSSFTLPAYKYIEDGVYSYGGSKLVAPLYLRMMAVPAKLFVYYTKGNTDIFTNFFMYAKNFLLGTTKVK